MRLQVHLLQNATDRPITDGRHEPVGDGLLKLLWLMIILLLVMIVLVTRVVPVVNFIVDEGYSRGCRRRG